MDFGLTNQQEMLRNMVSEYAETELAPKSLELDEKGEFPFHEVKRVAEQGLVGRVTSKEYGGSDMGHLARVIAVEGISRIYPPLGFFLQVGPIGMYILETMGTEEQKQKYLPSLCKGEKIMKVKSELIKRNTIKGKILIYSLESILIIGGVNKNGSHELAAIFVTLV